VRLGPASLRLQPAELTVARDHRERFEAFLGQFASGDKVVSESDIKDFFARERGRATGNAK
jgi:hypothetical protein